MNSYTIWYKRSNNIFWRKIKNVIGDGIIPESPNVRYIMCQDGTKYEFSYRNFYFKFSPERGKVIEVARNKEKLADIET